MLNLPSSGDFKAISVRYLVQSIDALFRSEMGSSEIRREECTKLEHWKDVQDVLFNSFTLLFLSIENFIKSRVCEVSPYLLIRTNPTEWSKGKHPSSFEDQYLYSLKDLIVIYEEEYKLKGKMTILYKLKDVIKKRNNIIHGLPIENLSAQYVFDLIYDFINQLWIEDWITSMTKEMKAFVINGHEFDSCSRLSLYMGYLEQYLGDEKIKCLLSLSEDQKYYFCPHCNHNILEFSLDNEGFEATQYAFFKEIGNFNLLYCPICQINYTVSQKPCINCEESVIFNYVDNSIGCMDSSCFYKEDVCLDCGSQQHGQ